ncbi:hypothetical protein PGTUg99_035900 [Puccinia graminis f. sp. tritici]|uniref:Uncharacterized protein n=1 Tax=Puccinia graminis f. sp. tritici TaxID=56615 RepID=A0A5B0SLP1_PUCGR|nr:hypothetical protein PGTUg99_035900 [Puccinia graminis f. sp. tritici]
MVPAITTHPKSNPDDLIHIVRAVVADNPASLTPQSIAGCLARNPRRSDYRLRPAPMNVIYSYSLSHQKGGKTVLRTRPPNLIAPPGPTLFYTIHSRLDSLALWVWVDKTPASLGTGVFGFSSRSFDKLCKHGSPIASATQEESQQETDTFVTMAVNPAEAPNLTQLRRCSRCELMILIKIAEGQGAETQAKRANHDLGLLRAKSSLPGLTRLISTCPPSLSLNLTGSYMSAPWALIDQVILKCFYAGIPSRLSSGDGVGFSRLLARRFFQRRHNASHCAEIFEYWDYKLSSRRMGFTSWIFVFLLIGPLDCISTSLPLSKRQTLLDIISGNDRFYDVTASPEGPLPPQVPGDAPWTQAESSYQKMISCPLGIQNKERGIVLLVPGTAGSANEAFKSSAYYQVLPSQGFDVCWVDTPNYSLTDMQLAAEFVAYAIKSLAPQSIKTGGKINIVSYSQGGPNGSNYMNAANSLKDTRSAAYALIPTTIIYTLSDEIVTPQLGYSASSRLIGASNIVLQSICPLSFDVDHLGIPGDVGAYGIALYALLNGRPAHPSTVDRSYCTKKGQ